MPNVVSLSPTVPRSENSSFWSNISRLERPALLRPDRATTDIDLYPRIISVCLASLLDKDGPAFSTIRRIRCTCVHRSRVAERCGDRGSPRWFDEIFATQPAAGGGGRRLGDCLLKTSSWLGLECRTRRERDIEPGLWKELEKRERKSNQDVGERKWVSMERVVSGWKFSILGSSVLASNISVTTDIE